MRVEPLHDNVLVERDKVEEKKTPGGIYIPTQGQKAPVTCTVVAVGPLCDKLPDGAKKKGAKVIVSTYAGVDIEIERDKFIMVKQEDILGLAVD